MTPPGIEPATFRFVAQRLNHCATTVPINKSEFTNFGVITFLKFSYIKREMQTTTATVSGWRKNVCLWQHRLLLSQPQCGAVGGLCMVCLMPGECCYFSASLSLPKGYQDVQSQPSLQRRGNPVLEGFLSTGLRRKITFYQSSNFVIMLLNLRLLLLNFKPLLFGILLYI